MLRISIVSIGLITTLACQDKTDFTVEQTPASDTELASIKTTIDGLYANIRVENGQTPEIEDILYYFAPQARMGSVKEGATSLQHATQYFDGWMEAMNKLTPELLKEWEIEGKSQYFGNIAYHTTKYGVYFNTTDSIAEQGIFNYQLVKLGDDWKVISMIWQAEDE